MGQISCPCHGVYTTAPYILCTDYVCVRLGVTSHALKVCLCESATGVDVSAGWARLARVSRWHSDALSSIPSGLVLQLLADGSPALGQDRPVQATLLGHILPGVFRCASGGARHVDDGGVLNGNHLVVADDFSRDAVFFSLQCLDALTLYSAELRYDLQVFSAWLLVPAKTTLGFSVLAFDVHPARTVVTQCSVSTTLYLALEATNRLPVLAGVDARELLVLVLN